MVKQSRDTKGLYNLPAPVATGPALELLGCDTVTAAETNREQS